MDLRLYLSVIWRFKLVVLLGLIVAAGLTTLTIAKVSFKNGHPKLTYRQQEQWTSGATIWVTQAGFPLGRSVYDKFLQVGTAKAPASIPEYANPNQFSSLATIYASLINSDPVTKIIAKEGAPLDGAVSASQPTLPGNASITLPFVQIAGTASSPQQALTLTEDASRALVKYVTNEQNKNDIAPDKRIVLQIVQHANAPVLTKPRKMTGPIVVFVASLMVAIGLAFLLENLRPRVRPVQGRPVDDTVAAAAARRSA